MIIQFKCKPKNGVIRRPELSPSHVVSGGPFNDLTFKMAMRKLYRAKPEMRLPREFSKDDLPSFVSIDESEFMAVVTIDYRGVA